MRSPIEWKGAGPAALTVTLLAAVLMLAAQSSYAGRGEGRGSQGVWRTSGERARSGGGDVRWKGDGGRGRGGDRAYGGGDVRYKGGGGGTRGGSPAWGGGARYKGDGGRVWSGGGSGYRGGGSYDRGWYGGSRYTYRSAPRYYGGTSYYYGSDCYPRSTYYYRYPRPRTYVSIGLGLPYYCPMSYRHVVVRRPVVSEYRDEVDVENLPPAGCYYYDPYCEREFSDLDSYTDHIDSEGHAQTIEIRYRDSGDYVRTLEFSAGYWVVQR